MAIYELKDDSLQSINVTTFAKEHINERGDLQHILKSKIEVVSPATLVISEEFGEFEGSRRRIDLLGIDKDANLVVIELKRTEDGGHMELQAIRYAAMVSNLTFDKAVEIFWDYMEQNKIQGNAEEIILYHLGWGESNEDAFGQDVRIVLVSAEFSKEITSSVLWLNDKGLNINCVRMRPYKFEDKLLIDIDQVLPLVEAADYQIKFREKRRKERESTRSNRDTTRFNLTINGVLHENQPKRWVMYYVVKGLIDKDVRPAQVMNIVNWRKSNFFWMHDSIVHEDEVKQLIKDQYPKDVKSVKRYFCNEEQLFHINGITYALSTQWGERAIEAVDLLNKAFPQVTISYSAIEK